TPVSPSLRSCSDPVARFCRIFSFFFLMMRRPPSSTLDRSSAASDVYKRQRRAGEPRQPARLLLRHPAPHRCRVRAAGRDPRVGPVSYTHLRAHELLSISYAVFCLKKKKTKHNPPPHHDPQPRACASAVPCP